MHERANIVFLNEYDTLLVYKALHDLEPNYISDVFRSQMVGLLSPEFKLKREAAFSFYAAHIFIFYFISLSFLCEFFLYNSPLCFFCLLCVM